MRPEGTRGFALVEVVVAVAIIAGALFGLVATVSVAITGSGTTQDTRIALAAMRAKVEDMRASDFDTFVTSWQGHTFSVADLRAPSGGGAHGSVTLLGEAQARAYLVDPAAATFLDLDADGVLEEVDAPADGWKAYAVLVRVTFGERSRNSDRALEAMTIVFDPEL